MIVAGLLDPIVGLLVKALQKVLDLLAGLVNGVIDAWPINMPDLPSIPSEMLMVFGWFQWGPIGIVVNGCVALLLFLVSVWVLVAIAGPVFRFLKVWE